MAVLSRSRGYLFIQAPRTASTAIARGILVPRLEGELIGEKHATLRSLTRRGHLEDGEAARLFVFSTVRNPFDSLVSLYAKMRNEYTALLDRPDSWLASLVAERPRYAESLRFASEHSFPEWIEYRFTRRGPASLFTRRPVSQKSPVPAHARGVDLVMRYERLQADFDRVLDVLGAESMEIPLINLTNSRAGTSYRDYYTPRAREIVEQVYRRRLEFLGYTF